MNTRTSAMSLSVLACAAALAACSSAGVDGPIGQTQAALDDGFFEGNHLFENALPGTNGRSCATCHVPEDHFTLTPAHVAKVYAEDPNDPLFNPIDADDPTAAVPTYQHLMAGMVRINITLADNLDVINTDGDVITNADRTVSVWRGVPTIENVTFTAPYQYDGRAATLPIQADDALHAHSQIAHKPSQQVLDQISDFERTVFSDLRAAEVGVTFDDGQAPPYYDIPLPPGSDAAAGEALFKQICVKCHGGPTTNVIPSSVVNDTFFPVQNADGTINVGGFLPTGVAIPTTFRTDLHFPQHMGTYGIAPIALLRQLGALPNPSGLTFPAYRIRFYTDATRTQQLVDMPPAPPGIGPSLIPEPYSIDPGRALITGNPSDWEGFKVLQLRGVSKTAPYFHDASAPDLQAVLDEYSQLILPAEPALNLSYAYPPETPGGLPESLSPTQKAQIIAFLQDL
jgi:cytochrome c peroxidase